MHITKSEVKLLRALAQKKIRDREKKFVIEGWKPLKDVLNSGFQVDYVAMTHRYKENPDYRSFINDIDSRGIELKELTDVELRQVSDTVHAQGVIAVIEQKTWTLDEILAGRSTLLVLADRIADPGNLGTMVRTCDWFGADALILSEGCVDLHNEKVVRSTSGSIFHIPLADHVDTVAVLSRLKKLGFWILATAGEAKTSYTEAKYGEKNVIIFGSEAGGVHIDTRRLADEVVGIPRRGKAESLNVGVACGIILSHLRNSR